MPVWHTFENPVEESDGNQIHQRSKFSEIGHYACLVDVFPSGFLEKLSNLLEKFLDLQRSRDFSTGKFSAS